MEWEVLTISAKALAVASSATLSRLPRAPRVKAKDKEWIHFTHLACLVNDMNIKSLEEIFLFSLPIKESEVTDFSLELSLQDEVLKIMSLAITNGLQFGMKCSKEVATVMLASLS